MLLRAESYDDIKPLIALCKAGKLFEVQDWIASGKAVNPPPPPEKGARKRTPLQYAIDLGFHSLVRVLLEGGAEIENTWHYCPMDHAVQERRLDIVKLLVEYGADPKDVDMGSVFYSWDPEMMEYFIEHGAEVEDGMPLAQAFISRIRTALRIYKKYQDRFPSFKEQANVALRYHCKEGNLKWVSLMLWLGADPFAAGEAEPQDEPDPDDEGLSAIGFAVLHDNYEVLELKQIRMDPDSRATKDIMQYARGEKGAALLRQLLEKGMNPNDQDNGGCSMITRLLSQLDWTFNPWSYDRERQNRDNDSDKAREKMKLIHILAKYGAHWAPTGRDEINYVRRSLLKMKADYTAEFVWIMSKYQACTRESMDDLLRTSTIRAVVAGHMSRINDLVQQLSEVMG